MAVDADIFEHAPCGYVILAPDGRIARANRLVERWTGRASLDLVGKRLPDLLKVSGRILHETHFAPLLKIQGFVNEIAFDIKAADGSSIQVLVNAVERRNEATELVSTFVVLFPALERRRYERALVDAQDALETGLRSEKATGALRDQFIAVLGHDLRNPLASIGSAARILSKETLSPKGQQVIALMQGSVARMAGLIDDVLDFARGSLGSGIGIALKQEVELSKALMQVIDELRAANLDRQIDATIDIPISVECDVGRLGQLLSNVLGNALTHGASSSPIEVSAETIGGVLNISVTNRGEPISDAARERLFQPFFRGDSQNTSGRLGLGLYIASEIAKAHSGTLDVSSNAEQTQFVFKMSIGSDR